MSKNIISKSLILLVIICLVWLYPTINNALYTATGFSAKNLCSGHFISGLKLDIVMKEALIPVSSTFGWVNYRIDKDNKTIVTNILGVFERRSVFHKGIGCTLLAPGQKFSALSVEQFQYQMPQESIPWPEGLAEINLNKMDSRYSQISDLVNKSFNSQIAESEVRTKAILVIHNGQLVAEKYSQDVDKNTPLLSWSMAKSVTNLQIALLVKDNELSLDSSLDIPGWNNDSRKTITLEHLLTMSSGLEFNETYGVGSDASVMLSVADSADEYARNKPLADTPGERWSYSSGTTNILSGIIKRKFKGDLQKYYDYPHQRLFWPLGITSVQIEMDASGTNVGSSYMYATARDWAKLGQFLLQKGVWKGQQILPKNWVDYSTTPTQSDPQNRYGAQIWLNRNPDDNNVSRRWSTVPEDAFFMSGFQGQNVVIIPSKQLVFVRLGFTTPGHDNGVEAIMSGVISILDSESL
ncbi:MAG: beta-lactamase family protein [Kangiellaceae bacterium]|nr:beta-lactamase family protein [Kangiellaceae bacterium]